MMDCDSERIWKIIESYRLNVPKRKHPSDSPPSLFDLLYDCYVRCNQTSSEKSSDKSSEKSGDKRFRSAVNLLEQLVEEQLVHPSLIVSLYSDEQGYSIILSPKEGSETEELFLPYEDNEIFSYLDSQELPPVLVEVVGQTKYCEMYSGCVVCEVRDYRIFSRPNGSFDKHLLLLRPTTETIFSTVEEKVFEADCSAEDKLSIESKVLSSTEPPICLDPTIDVICFTNRLQYNQRKYHTPKVRRTLRRRSHARRARMHLMSEDVAPLGLQLHDFITERAGTLPTERRRDFSNSWKKQKIDHQLKDTPEDILACILRNARPVTPPSPLGSNTPTSASSGMFFSLVGQPSSRIQRREAVREAPRAPPVSVPNEVPPVQRHPTHPPTTAPPFPPSHLHIPQTTAIPPTTAPPFPPSHLQIPQASAIPPTTPTSRVDEQQIQQPPIQHLAQSLAPPMATPTDTPRIVPTIQQLPVATGAATVVAAPPISTTPTASTIITPPQTSRPRPLTPTPPPHSLAQQHVPPSAVPAPVAQPSAVPAPVAQQVSVSMATPAAASQPPQQPSTSQPLLTYGAGSLQIPSGLPLPRSITSNPELLKLFITQMQMQAAATAAVAAAAATGHGRQKQPRPIAPAGSVAKVSSALGSGAPVVVKSKSPAIVGNPLPLPVAASSTAAMVAVSHPGGSSVVQVSPQVRPPLHSLTTPTPPSLTPSPKRSLSSIPSQNMPPAQSSMPKLHPLAQESSVSQKSSLPPQPMLIKPTVPPHPTSVPGPAPHPPAMPTLHKISVTPTPMPPTSIPPLQLQKAPPTVGGVIPTPPLKANPTAMPKLTTSLGQKVKVTPTGLPVLSRAPMTLQSAPAAKPHLQPRPLTHPLLQAGSTVSSLSTSSGFQLAKIISSTVAPPKLSAGHGTTVATAVLGKPPKLKHGGSSGKTGKSHHGGSGSKKKKK